MPPKRSSNSPGKSGEPKRAKTEEEGKEVQPHKEMCHPLSRKRIYLALVQLPFLLRDLWDLVADYAMTDLAVVSMYGSVSSSRLVMHDLLSGETLKYRVKDPERSKEEAKWENRLMLLKTGPDMSLEGEDAARSCIDRAVELKQHFVTLQSGSSPFEMFCGVAAAGAEKKVHEIPLRLAKQPTFCRYYRLVFSGSRYDIIEFRSPSVREFFVKDKETLNVRGFSLYHASSMHFTQEDTRRESLRVLLLDTRSTDTILLNLELVLSGTLPVLRLFSEGVVLKGTPLLVDFSGPALLSLSPREIGHRGGSESQRGARLVPLAFKPDGEVEMNFECDASEEFLIRDYFITCYTAPTLIGPYPGAGGGFLYQLHGHYFALSRQGKKVTCTHVGSFDDYRGPSWAVKDFLK